jgi:UDP-2,3-diacylglucosamine pyrophosphatase LpxH
MPVKIQEREVARNNALEQANRELKAQVDHQKRINRILSDTLTRAQRPVRAVPIAPASLRPSKSEFTRVIIPDSHGSAIDPAAAAAFLADLKTLAPREIVMLGDHVDCGGFLAQHHVLGYVAQTAYSYCDDLAAANKFLDEIQRAAPQATIHYIEGNHERRIETWCVTQTLRHEKDCEMLRLALAPEFRLHLAERGIRYYRLAEHYHGIRVTGAIRLGKCYFWHGVSTAKHAASVNLSQFSGNVVYGHTHREDSSSRRPVSIGDIRAWNPGCLSQLQPLWCHGRPTEWNHGYGLQSVLRSGEFMHINVPIIDGRSLLLPTIKAA